MLLGPSATAAQVQVPLEGPDPEGLPVIPSLEITEPVSPPDTDVDPGGSLAGTVPQGAPAAGADTGEPGGAASLGGSEQAAGAGGQTERGSRPDDTGRGSAGAGGRDAGARRSPARPGTCPHGDGTWVVDEGGPFGGHWRGSAASGILVFSSTRQEVRFDVDEGFALESACWQTNRGVGGSDARLERIDSDTYAVEVEPRSGTRLEQVTFDITPPPGEESAEEGVLGLVIRRGDLPTTGLQLLALAGLDLVLLLSGAALLHGGRRHPRHSRPSVGNAVRLT
ncbi:MAG: hypothetical protein ACRDKA_14230 [Actinomycetota bacterium]